jgi:signal transduction histidine kinase
VESSSDASDRDHAGEERDQAGDERDQAGAQRDQAGERRDQVSERRDQAGEDRDEAGEQRDEASEHRDQVADHRDQVADRRDRAAAQRDRAADQRDRAAAQRDGAAADRDEAAAHAESQTNAGISEDALNRATLARRQAASDRRDASEDRRAGVRERSQAEADRNTALADRDAGASERSQAVADREIAHSDRGAGASERSSAEADRETAQADRGAGADERTYAEADRSTAQADRSASATERDEGELVTEALAAARNAAMESSRLKSEFLATVSHEIRTPMNGVIGLTSLLLDTELDDQQRGYAEGAHGSGQALLAIVNDILDFSKVEANQLDLEVTDFNIIHMVEDVAGLIAGTASGKGLRLDVACEAGLPADLRGDPGRIRQVFFNLADNAVKFTDQGGVVLRVQSESETERMVTIRLEVSDTGIGIAEADFGHIFEAFRQADASSSRRFGGTGLGLAIAAHLTALMGGEIGVSSALGKGSTFWCTLPLSRATGLQTARQALPAAAPPASLPPSVRGRILVVEDNAVNQLVAVAMLRKLGYGVDVAADGREALGALGRTVYVAVLMDCMMPEMDGYQATAAIRRRPGPEGSTPIIAVTADITKGARERCFAVGMDGYIAKPYTIDEVDAVLVRCIGGRRTSGAAGAG